MQRRAAAAYFALFLAVSAGAYTVIGVAEKPHVDFDAPTYEPGDELTVDGRTYTVNAIGQTGGSSGGGHGGGGGEVSTVGNLTWTDPDAAYSATMGNNTTVSWQVVSWSGQDVQQVTLSEGDTAQYNGSLHEVVVNDSASPTMRLQQVANESINDTFSVGNTVTLRYQDQRIFDATLTDVSDDEATLTWGDPYRVLIPNRSDPDTARLVQEFNVTRRLLADQAVNNETTVVDGVRSITFPNGTYRPLDEYLPEPEVFELEEGDTLAYDGNETTVGNITVSEVPLNWNGSRTYLVELSQGASLTLNDQPFFVHFPDAESVQVAPNGSNAQYWQAYQADLTTIDSYNERMSGLWAVTILSLIAGLILIAAAYTPVKD